jgi:hypothetical protein
MNRPETETEREAEILCNKHSQKTKSMRSSHTNKEEKPLGSVHNQYVKSVSEKLKRIGN